MPQIVTHQGQIQQGNDLQFDDYRNYLESALVLNGWDTTLLGTGNSGYAFYELSHGQVQFTIHTYLKPVKWRGNRPQNEKQHQMAANVDMRGFNVPQTSNEFTTIFGIYRDPTSVDNYLICAWHQDQWGPRKGEKPYNHNLRVELLRDAFLFGFAVSERSQKKVFAFKPEFIHYYLNNHERLYGSEQVLPVQTSPSSETTLANTPLNQILYGPPGTGKTYATISKAVEIVNGVDTSGVPWLENKEAYDNLVDQGRIRFVTFHQSYSYEEFIEGIKPIVDENNNVRYDIIDGTFKKLCTDAAADDTSNYVMIIDEINRGNISRIFGELITLIEDSKRLSKEEALTAKLTYSGQDEDADSFGVPSNVFIIGTMNSADRSIALIDTALRRRFTFYNYPSLPSLISTNVESVNVRSMFEIINRRIEFLLDKDHLIGHGYFMHVSTLEQLGSSFRNKVIPLLEEYFYGDFEKIQLVLGDNPEYNKPIELRMISISPSNAQRELFGTDIDGFEDKSIYNLRSDLQQEEYDSVSANVYKSIYGEFPESNSDVSTSEQQELQGD